MADRAPLAHIHTTHTLFYLVLHKENSLSTMMMMMTMIMMIMMMIILCNDLIFFYRCIHLQRGSFVDAIVSKSQIHLGRILMRYNKYFV